MSSVSILVPAYNEAVTVYAVLHETVAELSKAVEDRLIQEFEIIVLDDGSTDSTWHEIIKFESEFRTLRAYQNSEASGLQKAFSFLLAKSKMEWNLIFPGDGEWDASGVYTLLKHASEKNWSCGVVGNRENRLRHYNLFRAVLSYSFSLVSQIILKQDIKDPGSIKLLPKIIEKEDFKCTSPLKEIERLWRTKFTYNLSLEVINVPWQQRSSGKATGASFKNLSSSFLEIPKLYFWTRIVN